MTAEVRCRLLSGRISAVQIRMLGPFEVRTAEGAAVEVPGARLRALLIALALEAGKVVPRTILIDWIWGENPPADEANALQRLVSRLRKALRQAHGSDEVIEGQSGGYRLAVDPESVDALRFERMLNRARQRQPQQRLQLLREALEIWRGAAMADVGLEESTAFDAAVTRWEGLRLAAMEDRFDAEVELGHGADVVAEVTDAVTANPLRERLVAALMRALVAAGRDADALLAYEQLREGLADTLGADPSPEVSSLHTAILRGELSRPKPSRKSNVRAELTTFVGRDAEVIAVRDLIADYRLTTLIGPGGSGKTRLATETARSMFDDLPDGIWLVELAARGDDSDVAQAALTALGLRDALLGTAPGTDPVDGIIAAIRDREMLLILDNCEHLIDAVARFADRLLGECRLLRILATSREPLGITGEALWPVEPLTMNPAVELLRDRARAVRKDLGTDEQTTQTLMRICRALDGMPLAIELAAARLRTMTLDQLARRLDDRFRLLTSGSRTALPRHQTLRAVVDWSWELLTDAERVVLRRLSIFAGGTALEAAEQICVGDPDRPSVQPDEVLEILTSLVEKSLVIADGDDVTRYRMLTTIREYAADRLADAGESEQLRLAHLSYFTALVEAADPHLRGADQLRWLARLGADHANLTAAMRGAIAAGDAQAAMRFAAGAGWYWWLGGRRAEGLELLVATARMSGTADDDVRAMTYALVAQFVTSGRSDEHVAADWIHQAYELGRTSSRQSPLLELIVPLEQMLADPGSAVVAFESVLTSDDPWVRALGRLQAGRMRMITGQGGPEAEALVERSAAEFRALGERFGISLALSELGTLVGMRGDFATACALYDEAIDYVTEVGAVEDVIRIRTQQALLYELAGDPQAADRTMAEAERLGVGVTWAFALAELAFARAELARLRGDATEARRQIGSATALLGDGAEEPNVRAAIHDALGYLAEDVRESRIHRVAAWQAANEAGHRPLIAQIVVGLADLSVRLEQDEQAARLLTAGSELRGMPDRTRPDAARIEQVVRDHLGEAQFTEVTQDGELSDLDQLVEQTLAS